jgi:ABC-type polar amino acid transport system ATPase subunit
MTLDKVDIDVSGDKVVIVCGPVGSGKVYYTYIQIMGLMLC